MQNLFKEAFKGKTVLVTGHTGFKGSWLSIWLNELGAKVIGYSLEPAIHPNNYHLTRLQNKMISLTGDIRDLPFLKKIIRSHAPEVIFHLAAQAIVLHSYALPHDTMEINAMGTVNVLEAARESSSLRAMVMVTTDKCYDNREWLWGYRENDPLGGKDPYSASKAMAELAIQSYRDSFYAGRGPLVASARAGNVIGGGDFSEHRLIPDIMKALLENRPIEVRNPYHIRPWLHVLDPLSGYLRLAAKLMQGEASYAQAWNFGPSEQQGVSVQSLVEKSIEYWGEGKWIQKGTSEGVREMNHLRLNWDRAAHLLSWRPLYSWTEAIGKTVEWFRLYEASRHMPRDMYGLCVKQIHEYSEAT